MNVQDNTGSDERQVNVETSTMHSTSSQVRPRTRLGAQLLELRRAGIAAGIPRLSWREIEAELDEQRRNRP